MRPYDRKQPLVSLHVPKTAGTSLRTTLREWYPKNRLLLHYPKIPGGEAPAKHPFKGPICIHGHFNASRGRGVDDYYPQAEQFIVFLRDPFERAVSLYFHMIKSTPIHAGEPAAPVDAYPTFQQFLETMAADHAAGTGVDAYQWFFPRAPNVEAIKADMAERYVFVGVTERYSESLGALAKVLGRPVAAETFENSAERTREDFGRWRAFHEAAFPEDYEIYQTAMRLNAEHLARLT